MSRNPFNDFTLGKWRPLAVGAAFILASIIGGFGGAWLENHDQQNSLSVSTVGGQKKVVTSESRLISQIAQDVGSSVVSVNVAIASTPSTDTSGLFGLPSPALQAAGTGIMITSKGLIITNRHVVPKGTTAVSVTLSDGTELKDVSVVGRTNASDSLDIAFLKINNAKGHSLKAASLGDSSTVQVGDNVVAIGNALGQFQNTVTSGIISGYGRSVQATDSTGTAVVENLDDLFQTDAAINEGNSGGPLVSLGGQVIGINTAIAGGAQNIGFAIPINNARGLIDQVVQTGKLLRPYLGVRYVPLTPDIAGQYGLKVSRGAFIVPSPDTGSPSILPDGPAAKAGIKERDVITAVDDKKVDQAHSLTSLLGTHKPGDKVTLTVQRADKALRIQVTLGALPENQ